MKFVELTFVKVSLVKVKSELVAIASDVIIKNGPGKGTEYLFRIPLKDRSLKPGIAP